MPNCYCAQWYIHVYVQLYVLTLNVTLKLLDYLHMINQSCINHVNLYPDLQGRKTIHFQSFLITYCVFFQAEHKSSYAL